MSETTTETPAAEPETPAAQATPEPAAQPVTPAREPAQPAAPAEPDSVEKLPAWAQKLIRDTRTDAATQRTRAKEHSDALAALETKSQSQLDGIAKALGLKPEEATPDQIMAERDAEKARAETSDARARASAVELAVFRAASGLDAKGDALLDSRSFLSRLEGMDPSADDFQARVKDAIESALAANPAAFRVSPPPPAEPAVKPKPEPTVKKSGGEFSAPGEGPRQLSAEDASRMTPAEVQEAVNKGLFAATGFGPARRAKR